MGLEQAARALLAKWDAHPYTPWREVGFISGDVANLREALAEQAEHEQVAVLDITYGREPECYATPNADDLPEGTYRLYAAPVPVTTPDVCGEVCARAKLCYGCDKALDEANASWMSHDELKAYWSGYGNGKQKALSEPVAFKFPREPKPEQSMGWTIDHKVIRSVDAEIEDNEFKPCCESVEQVLLALEKVYAAPVQQAEHEIIPSWEEYCECEGIPCEPVKPVDLTDDEIYEVLKRYTKTERYKDDFGSYRAVIAADREKNRA